MVKNHPYVDGNKRLGLAATFFFLGLNGRILVVPNDEMVEFATELAATQMKWRTVARWIREHSVTIDRIQPGNMPVVYVEQAVEPQERRFLLAERVVQLGVQLPKHLEALEQRE